MTEEKKDKSVTCEQKNTQYTFESKLYNVLVRATDMSAGHSEAMKVQLSNYIRS